jgi:hypothetical protein
VKKGVFFVIALDIRKNSMKRQRCDQNNRPREMHKRNEQVTHAWFVEEIRVQTGFIAKDVIQDYQPNTVLRSIA